MFQPSVDVFNRIVAAVIVPSLFTSVVYHTPAQQEISNFQTREIDEQINKFQLSFSSLKNELRRHDDILKQEHQRAEICSNNLERMEHILVNSEDNTSDMETSLQLCQSEYHSSNEINAKKLQNCQNDVSELRNNAELQLQKLQACDTTFKIYKTQIDEYQSQDRYKQKALSAKRTQIAELETKIMEKNQS